MCCGHQHHYGMEDQPCCCGPHLHRRFLSKQERIARLEAYKQDLERETGEVEQELQSIRQAE